MTPAPLPFPTETESRGDAPRRPARAASSPRRVPRVARSHGKVRQSTVLEASVKLTVNLLLGTVAASTLARMLPHYRIQAAELVALEQATDYLSQENQALWQEFSRNFAPEQASNLMREQSGRQAPAQMPIVWVEPNY
ncbi:MAG: hypothetical protein AAFU71_00330 [Cyanobacteria bacterium J06632_22]